MCALLSEAYFQGLLAQPDGVHTVSQFWARRVDGNAPQFALTAPEYAAQLILIYVGEVGNGGHIQFFLNRGVARVAETIMALRDVGLGGLAETLSTALAVWETGDQALNERGIVRQLQGPDSDVDAGLTSFSTQLAAYLRLHQDKVLVAERGLTYPAGQR